ncbi:MAG: M20/M25/M40 family metallo-hydrolase [Longimicrobiales bacterium]|nr:M20/M25/M40 family metallo-hydrolase [Longimicrobiales bacterium]
MKRLALLLLPALLAAACTTSRGSEAPPSLAAAAETITPTDVRARIGFLASDALRGRDTPSPGLDTAAHWIADELASFGLEPGIGDGWLQRYPYPAVSLDAGEATLRVAAGATHMFTYGEDFWAEPGSEAEPAGMVYVGSELPEGAEVRDRVVLLRLAASLEQGRDGWRLDRQARRQAYATVDRAAESGAAAVVFVLDSVFTDDAVTLLAATAERPSRVLGGPEARPVPPALFLRWQPALRIFRMAGLDGATILSRPARRPIPLPGVTATAAAPRVAVDDARPPNVVGVLRGRDPVLRDRYVVVTAHMDHVGVGQPDETGDSIYNGADDDASGTAALVEVAEALAGLETRPRRSVMFVAVSGEEKGLLGSAWFVDHPPVPVESMVANVNLDMVGRNAPDSIVVIGQEYSSMGPLVRAIAADNPGLGLTVSEDLWPEERFFFRSDHFPFAAKEIPALFFFAGTHEDYHRPSDEIDDIDTDKVARVGRLVLYLVHAIADAEEPPMWDPQGLETVRSLTTQ